MGVGQPSEFVNLSFGEYVRDMAHTNVREAYWAVLKRIYHHMGERHLQR